MRDVRWILCGLALALAACGGPLRDDGLRDADGDGFFGAADCDDHDRSVWQDRPGYRDADADGFGVGPVKMLCTGAALPAGWAARDGDCDDTLPGGWRTLSAYRDLDGDGAGAGDRVTVCAGTTLPAEYSETTGDCDDGDVTRWRVVERYADLDLDGIGAEPLVAVCFGSALPAGWSERSSDCAPDDPLRFQELGYLYSDADGDTWLASQPGTVCSGAQLPPGYTAFPPAALDCDDGDASRFASLEGYLDSDGDGAGTGRPTTFCTGGSLPSPYVAADTDCAPDDPERWQLRAYASVDADHDGVRRNVAGSICTGATLPDPYFAQAVSAPDCDDSDAALSTLRTGYADPDLDGVTSGPARSVCSGAALPEGWLAAPAGNDCAPDDPSAWQLLTYYYVDEDGDGRFVNAPGYQGSVCTGGTLPPDRSRTAPAAFDCDDANPEAWAAVYAYLDADQDGVGAGASTRFCNAGETPDGYSLVSTDCAADDRARWRSVSYLGVDEDADGYTVQQPGALCLGGEALPDPYRTALAGNDCDDADATLWRYVVLYPDLDGDGIGATPRIGATCLGATIPEGTSIFGFDPDDHDPARREDATAEASILAL